MPDVSLVTVTFGDIAAATRVGSGLEAAQRTGGDPPMEVVVVAAGPAGGEAAKQLVALTVGTSLTPQVISLPEGCGYSQAANAGVAKTTGDIVVVAQPDVSFHQRFLRRVRIEASEKWDFLAPAVREGDDGQIATGATRRGKTHRLVTVQTPFRGDAEVVSAGNAACVIVRRHVLEQRLAEVEGLFDPAYATGDDLDLFWWAEKKGLVIRFVPTLIVGRAVGTEFLPTSPE
ncbi:MAG: glycosyltransferase family 2 protein, partial [Acidimicrobiales bacterium]